MIGELTVLNVGEGDTKLTFDKKKPEEVKRAKSVVEDMLKRGFAILVQVGTRKGKPLYQRAESFDSKTEEYIIVGAPPEADEKPPMKTTGRGSKKKTRVPAASTQSVAVARSAGG